jgi:hypothetical protein
MMADNQLVVDVGDEDIFVHTGGRVPRHVRRVRFSESVSFVRAMEFLNCEQLIEVGGHDKIKKIKQEAFIHCRRLRWVSNMNGVIEIEVKAFFGCNALCHVEFDKLEIIGECAFGWCRSLVSVSMPSIRRVGKNAFQDCDRLTDVAFGEDLEGIEEGAFLNCTALRRIAIPLKDGLIVEDDAFDWCGNLSSVDVIGGIHKTITSLHMESWRDEMYVEIDMINQTLPDTPLDGKTAAIQQWIVTVIARMEHYKFEHQKFVLKEAMTLLELALWKAKLNENESNNIDVETVGRKEHRVTCGASIVIKNVLPFLALK